MNKKQKKLIAISVLMQTIYLFFELFFGIFTYELTQNLNIIITYNLLGSITFVVFMLIIYKFLNNKILNILYKSSFLLSLIAILASFTIDKTRIFMIFVAQIILYLSYVCYYLPHEVATMNTNETSKMKKFLGLSSALSLFVGFLSPLLSGYIIDTWSYTIIFTLLAMLSIICFILSLKTDFVRTSYKLYGIKNFLKTTLKNPPMRLCIKSYFLYHLANGSLISIFLPLLLFTKTQTNFSVGIYSGLASLIAGIVLVIYCYYNKNKPLALWINTIAQVLSAFAIICFKSMMVFFIYYFIRKITIKILQNGVNESILTMLNGTSLQTYKIENFYTYNFFNHFAILISSMISFIIYNLINNSTAITFILILFSFIQIPSTFLINKYDKLKGKYYENSNDN
ncbi:MAG: hypothetical protein IJA61_02050 [Clostridia bacterium]|nr:hypothetical protein [Clostridia bacterium]